MRIKRPALQCATVGIMAAALECVKLALSFIPNVEAVTLFSAVFGYCFGTLGVLASLIFVLIEPLVWGFGPWVVSYIIYWPSLTAIFAIIGARVRKKGSCERKKGSCEMKSVPLSNGGAYGNCSGVPGGCPAHSDCDFLRRLRRPWRYWEGVWVVCCLNFRQK